MPPARNGGAGRAAGREEVERAGGDDRGTSVGGGRGQRKSSYTLFAQAARPAQDAVVRRILRVGAHVERDGLRGCGRQGDAAGAGQPAQHRAGNPRREIQAAAVEVDRAVLGRQTMGQHQGAAVDRGVSAVGVAACQRQRTAARETNAHWPVAAVGDRATEGQRPLLLTVRFSSSVSGVLRACVPLVTAISAPSPELLNVIVLFPSPLSV